MFRTLTAVAALLALSSAAYAQTTTTETEVEQEAEEAATEVENAAEDAAAATEEAAEDAAAATEEAAEDAAAATEEAVEGAAAATEEAVDETEEAVDEAAAETEVAVDAATTETETVEIQPVEEDAEAVETADAETMSQGAPFANVTLEYGQNYLATTLIGQRIYAIDDDVEQDAVFPAGTQADWDDIGEIGDMVIGVDGTLEAVVIDVGGFLGIGEREVAIQWDAIRGVREDDDENEYFLAVTMPEEAMENAPELEREPAVSE